MKYIKSYESKRFQVSDYVKFIDDFVNGYPTEGISKEIFQIRDVILAGTNRNGDKIRKNMHSLVRLNSTFYAWSYEDDLRLATPEEVELYIDTKKYNL